MLLAALSFAVAAPPAGLAAPMHERFTLATRIRDDVVQGRLDEARTLARALAELGAADGLPADAAPFVAALSAEAAKVASAPDLVTAALATGRMVASCGACHGATGGGPGLDRAGDIPPQVWEPGRNMELHAWALDWMWLGLIANDDPAWTRGAAELVRRPLAPRFEDAPPPGSRTQLEQLVYLLAGQALEADAPAERADVYGKLLATCSECHTTRR